MIAVALGARVVAIDLSVPALELATTLGATAVVTAGPDVDTVPAVVEITGGGAHVGIDDIGQPSAAAASVASLRRRGRHVQIGLLLGDQACAALPMDLVITRELEIYGSHGMAAHEYPAMLEAVADGRLHPELLVGTVVPFEHGTGVLAAMDRPAGPGLTVLEMTGGRADRRSRRRSEVS